MSQNSSIKNFTGGGIFLPMLRFTFLIMSAMIIQMLYGAVDLLVVGQFSDADNVAAVSIGSQLMHALTLVLTELAVGTTVILGQLIGEKKTDECGRIVGSTICFFAAAGIIITFAMQFLAPGTAVILNTPAEAFDLTVSYIRICCGGTLFIIGYNIIGSIFRGLGDAKMPLITILIAGIANIIGDFILVYGFGMGAAGAAYATVASQAISVFLSILIIRRKGLPFPFGLSDLKFNRTVIKRIVRLGAPLAIHDLLVGISFLIILAIINRFGVIAAAGIGIAEKLIGFIMLLPISFSQSIATVVAQNYGANKTDRAVKALRYGIACSLFCSFLIGYLSFFHGKILSGIFSYDADICFMSAEYLKAYAIDCLFTSFLFCYMGFFNGCGKTAFVMIQGIIGAFALRVPLSLIFSFIEPVSLFYIGLAAPCTTVIQNIMCFVYLKLMSKKSGSSNH